MENQTPAVPVITPQVTVERPKNSNFLIILLSILLFISLSIAGFFAYQTQQLTNELRVMSDELRQTPISTPTTSKFTDNTKEEACVKEKYTWSSKYNECESPTLTEAFCKKEKGNFFGCESPCRHDGDDGACITLCMAVCKFD